MTQPPTPECERLLAVNKESNAIGQFLDWLLEERHIVLAEHTEHHGLQRARNANINLLLHDYFRIDQREVEAERRALLEYIRNHHDNG